MTVPWCNVPGWLAIFPVALAPLVLTGEEPARRSAAPIIFSSPQSDTVSSNLNELSELSVKASPLRSLDSDLKKPFEVFEPGSSSFRPQMKPTAPPAPVINSKKLRELMEKRAEELYLGSESSTPDETAKAEDDLDPFGKKIKTPLDSYYDRLDRQTAAMTNQSPRSDDSLFKLKADAEEPDNLGLGRFRNPLETPSLPTSKNLRPLTGTDHNPYADSLKPKAFGDIFGLGPVESSERFTKSKETRLDNFKRLLDGPVATPRTDFNAPPPVAGAAAKASSGGYKPPAPSWSSSPRPANPADTFDKRAGLVGTPSKPQALPDFAASASSLSTPPQPQPARPLPLPAFKVPKRQF
jgi:hypothetical protein